MASVTPIHSAKRIVVKIGSALLVDSEKGSLRVDWLKALAKDIAAQKQAGRDVLVVSSGSIALGRQVLGLGDGNISLEQSQAAAAVGQIQLARAYEEALQPHGIKTAQILLTLEDSAQRRRYLNSRATFSALLSYGVVPIVNENDTVATDEIRYGDNDRLGAQVASMAGADVLVLLSDVDGLYTANPQLDSKADLVPMVSEITPEIEAMAGGAMSKTSNGGMHTKIMAAKVAMKAGCAMAIMQGDQDQPLKALEDGATATWFVSQVSPQAARKQWVSGMKPRGQVVIDAGAARALSKGKSLLPAGVVSLNGVFERGDPVAIVDQGHQQLAIGLIAYNAEETQAILGRQSAEIEEILGYGGRSALIHRDDMVI